MPITGGITTLSGLSGVNISAPANSHILHYNGTEWHNLDSATDWLSQYLYLPGRASGQTLGANAHTGGTLYDLAVEGRLLLGDNLGTLSYTNSALTLRHNMLNSTQGIGGIFNLATLTGVASGGVTLMSLSTTGNMAYSSGSFFLRGFSFIPTAIVVPSGVTLVLEAARFQVTFGSGTLGTVANYRGLAIQLSGSPSGGNVTTYAGLEVILSNSASIVTTLRGIYLNATIGTFTGTVTTCISLDIDTFFNRANVVDWSGLRIGNVTLPTGQKWGLNCYGDVLKHRICGPTAIGWVPATNAAVTSQCHLAAGTASAGTSPLKIQPGTNLTAPESGAVENDGVDFFVTDNTGDRNRIAPRLLSRTLGIDTTVVAANLIYTVPAGRKLVVVDVIIRTTAYNAGNFTCNVKGAAVGDIVASFTTTFAAVDQGIKPIIVTPFTIQAAGQAIHLDITATTTVATTTVAVDLIGYLI